MPHTVIVGASVCYRTKLMQHDNAQRFASCLKANSRFRNVLVNKSQRATSAKAYYVTFEPSNPERERDLLAVQQSDRERRAHEGGMVFLPHDRFPWVHYCYSLTSQETYEVTSRDCSCPDWGTRCRQANLRCKHILALALHLKAEREKTSG